MKQSTADGFQTGLLLLLTAVLVVNALLFVRLQTTQTEILREIRRLGAGSSAATTAPTPESLPAGTTAPAFELSSLAGSPVSLADYRGESVLLIFSSTTCPACDSAYPSIRAFDARADAPEVVMISRGSKAENLSLRDAKSLDMPILEWRDEVARAYQIPGTPWGVLVDAEGRVARTGVVTADFLESLGALSSPSL